MNFRVLILCALILGAGVYVSSTILRPTQEMDVLTQKIDREVQQLNTEAATVGSLADDPLVDVSFYYLEVSRRLNIFSGFSAYKKALRILRTDGAAAIALAAKPSSWVGIRKIDMQINFYDIAAMDQTLSILKFFGELRRSCPVEILSINQKDKNMDIKLALYGT